MSTEQNRSPGCAGTAARWLVALLGVGLLLFGCLGGAVALDAAYLQGQIIAAGLCLLGVLALYFAWRVGRRIVPEAAPGRVAVSAVPRAAPGPEPVSAVPQAAPGAEPVSAVPQAAPGAEPVSAVRKAARGPEPVSAVPAGQGILNIISYGHHDIFYLYPEGSDKYIKEAVLDQSYTLVPGGYVVRDRWDHIIGQGVVEAGKSTTVELNVGELKVVNRDTSQIFYLYPEGSDKYIKEAVLDQSYTLVPGTYLVTDKHKNLLGRARIEKGKSTTLQIR